MSWYDTATLYQIYPLGLCGAPAENDGVLAHRITRIMDWIPHLQKLGVGAVVFNPLFQSDRHGYDTRDYLTVDCRLGDNADFKKLCDGLHKAGIRVMLDGVFNHVGRGFWAFQDVLKNRESSPYKDWFNVNFGGNSNYNDGLWYEGWEGHFELVKLNLRNSQVVDYLLSCVGKWVEEFGVDGLRLDVAYCIDPDFLRALRRYCDNLKPEFFLYGEIIGGDYRRIVAPDLLPSCTNYECYKGLWSSFNDRNLFEIAHSLHRLFSDEAWAACKGMRLVSFTDNHDVARLATNLKDKSDLPLVYAMLYAMPGIPILYYGSEWGIEGDKKQGDAALRPALEKPEWNALTDEIAGYIALRKESPALCLGSFCNLHIQNKQLAFVREFEGQRMAFTLNLDENEAEVDLKACGGRRAVPARSAQFWDVD